MENVRAIETKDGKTIIVANCGNWEKKGRNYEDEEKIVWKAAVH